MHVDVEVSSNVKDANMYITIHSSSSLFQLISMSLYCSMYCLSL